MKRLSGALLAATALASAVPLAAYAEPVCAPSGPDEPSFVQGHTWTGTVTSAERGTIWFDVDAVYAHDPGQPFPKGQALEAGKPFRLRSETRLSDCQRPMNMGFDVGARYLVSSSEIHAEWTSRVLTAAWRLTGSRAVFVDEMYRGRYWPGFDDARTLKEALAIVAPLAIPQPSVPTIPPTDAPEIASPRPGPVDVWALIVASAMSVGLVLVHQSRRRARGLGL